MTRNFFFLISFLLPFWPALNPTADFDLALIRILIPLLFLLWLAESLLNKKLLVDIRLRFFYLIIFSLIGGFSFFGAENSAKAARKILFLFSLLPIYLVSFSLLRERKNLKKFLKIFFWSVFSLAIIGLTQFFLQFILGIDFMLEITKFINPFFIGQNFAHMVEIYPSWLVNIGGRTFLRTYAIFPDPHLFSLYLNMALPLVLATFYIFRKKIYLIGFFVILLANWLSFARAGILALILIASLFLIIYTFNKNSFKKKLTLIISILILFTGLTFIPNPLSQRLISILNLQEGSIQGRLEMWQIGWNLTFENPLIGVGLGNFSENINPQSGLRDPSYAHNLFLDFSAETGIINGLFLVLILFSPVFSAFYHSSVLNRALAFSFLFLIIHGMFETPFYSVHLFPLILILLSIDLSPKTNYLKFLKV